MRSMKSAAGPNRRNHRVYPAGDGQTAKLAEPLPSAINPRLFFRIEHHECHQEPQDDLQNVDRYLPLTEADVRTFEEWSGTIPDQITRVGRLLCRVANTAALMAENPVNGDWFGERSLLTYNHEAAEVQLGIVELFENVPANRAAMGGDLRQALRHVLDEARSYLEWCTHNDGVNADMAASLFPKWDDLIVHIMHFVDASKENLLVLSGRRPYACWREQTGNAADGDLRISAGDARAKTIREVRESLMAWRVAVTATNEANSAEARRIGGQAMRILFRNIPVFRECARTFGADPVTSSILGSPSLALDQMSDEELDERGTEGYLVNICKDQFIDDLRRWEELAGRPDQLNQSMETGKQMHAKAFTCRYSNQVPWNDADPAYYTNTDAISEARRVGTNHEIDHLKKLNSDKLNKFLRSPGCIVTFMSRRSPCRGRVHQEEWQRYLRQQVDGHNRFEEAVERRASELAGM